MSTCSLRQRPFLTNRITLGTGFDCLQSCDESSSAGLTYLQLRQLGDLLHQSGEVGAQASESHQQEATQSPVPRVSSLQAVLAGDVKTPLRRHGGNSSTVKQLSPLMTNVDTCLSYTASAGKVPVSLLLSVRGTSLCVHNCVLNQWRIKYERHKQALKKNL